MGSSRARSRLPGGLSPSRQPGFADWKTQQSVEVKVRDDEQVRRTALHETVGEFVAAHRSSRHHPSDPSDASPSTALCTAGETRALPLRAEEDMDRAGLRQPRGSTDGRRSHVHGLHEASRATSWHHTKREGEDEQRARPTRGSGEFNSAPACGKLRVGTSEHGSPTPARRHPKQ